MGAVADPGAARRDPLALHHRSGMSNHRYEITLATGLHLQDGEPVLGVVVGNALNGARERFERRCCFGGRLRHRHRSERLGRDHAMSDPADVAVLRDLSIPTIPTARLTPDG